MVFKKKVKTEDKVPEPEAPTPPQMMQQPQQYPPLPTAQQPMQPQMQPPVMQQPTPQPVVKSWSVSEVATETTPVIINATTGEQMDLMSAVAELLNRTE